MELDHDHERLYKQMKSALTLFSELIIPDSKDSFFVTVDASSIGLGAVLFQIKDDEVKKRLT